MPHELRADLLALDEATSRLVRSADALTDDEVAAPSLLPGWSRGHVLTHIARNADGMVRLVDWAVTGVPTPMYDSVEARNADIEAGAGRPAAELADDVRGSADRLRTALERLAEDLDAYDRLLVFGPMRPGVEPDTPARTLPYARTREVEIHHVDLGVATYTEHEWPPEFVERTLLWVHARSGPVDVVGEPAEVLAWRLGRTTGPSLTRLDGSPPGDAPPW
ncbi:MAG: maleylpyruvate isomerase family mycothiol-dependent enzyme [Candidatus Nanopelagicales bacterium]